MKIPRVPESRRPSSSGLWSRVEALTVEASSALTAAAAASGLKLWHLADTLALTPPPGPTRGAPGHAPVGGGGREVTSRERAAVSPGVFFTVAAEGKR